ncbi:hypothetical protein [Legionella erythra]|uniref:Uncharacterized protein n=1 Tax=Legionella erythra TaxID=448 RepID=A0A0W0TGM2_LEGER|nr:hypothetical protein [Legionella erythra]KTC94715.1 hypothetical protein Lery_2882 [Legionella erythra]
MSYVTIEVEEKKKKKLLDLYHEFLSKEKSKAQAFNSLDEFKKSPGYQDLSEEEQEHFKHYEGKNVVVLVFDNAEQAIEFIEQAQLKGLLEKGQAEEVISQLSELNQSSYKMGM